MLNMSKELTIKDFIEIDSIGCGAFSTVYKVQSIKDGNIYAIKKIPFSEEHNKYVKKEIQFLSTLKSEFVVKYIDSWIEENYYIGSYDYDSNKPQNLSDTNLLYNPHLPLLLHIQMELCTMSLRDVILNYNHKGENIVNTESYALACKILMQILNGVHFLHSYKPAIIHRDLKPENILIIQSNDEINIKLADFGSSTFHEFVYQSHTKYVGTKNYRAPETKINSHYDNKTDIYSLGIIMQELFNINYNKDFIEFNDMLFDRKYKSLMDITMKCLDMLPKSRPNCKDIIEMSDSWFYDIFINYNELVREIKSKITVINKTNYLSYTMERNKYRAIEINDSLYGIYKQKFNDICILGSGGYGEVWKSSDVSFKQFYAIKKIKILTNKLDELNKYVKREIKILSDLNETYVVKYYNSWISENYYVEKSELSFPYLMHIQMEMCLLSLEDITFKLINPKQINKDNKVSEIPNSRKLFETIYDDSTNLLNYVGYYITTELLIEVLDCVNYLHNCKPEVMHRDLKPSNILITFNGTNRFVKLADFGLATLHEFAEQSHTVGVGTYTCPDMTYGYYDTKSDIYCLHYVLSELFNITVNSKLDKSSSLYHKYEELQELLVDMSQTRFVKRPNCTEILNTRHKWGLSFEEALNDEKFNSILTQEIHNTNLIENFAQIYIKTKSELVMMV